MTTEFPSGESSIVEKLTELKNSSSVTFALSCAINAEHEMATNMNESSLVRIIASPGVNEVYTRACSREATGRVMSCHKLV
jgi:hypothetical protein